MPAVLRPGHQPVTIRHGLYVRATSGLKLRHRKVRRLVTKMREALPWLAPADEPACRAWAEFEILGARAFAELETNGLTNAAGEPRRLLSEFRQLRQAQLAFERELGMTPAARMGLRVGDSRARSLDIVAALANDTEAGGGSRKIEPPPRQSEAGPVSLPSPEGSAVPVRSGGARKAS